MQASPPPPRAEVVRAAPAWLAAGVFSLLILVIALVAFFRIMNSADPADPHAASASGASESSFANDAVRTRVLLQFVDRPDGSIDVVSVAPGASGSSAPFATLARGEGGFVRGVLRGLVRERRSQGLSLERPAPFALAQWSSGRLSLEDTATGRVLDLRAFGPTNVLAFQRLLVASRPETRTVETQ